MQKIVRILLKFDKITGRRKLTRAHLVVVRALDLRVVPEVLHSRWQTIEGETHGLERRRDFEFAGLRH